MIFFFFSVAVVVIGVEAVKAEVASNKITIVGAVDPSKIREKLDKKTKKKIDLISPQPKKDNKDKEPKQDNKPKDHKSPDDKKPKEVAHFFFFLLNGLLLINILLNYY